MRRYVDDATSIVALNDVNLDVEGNTHVKGALIKSEEGDVNVNTDTFTFEDIYNTDTYESSSFAVSGSYSTSGDNVSADPFAASSSGPSASASLQRDGVLDTISKLPTIEYENITSEKIGITRATVAADEGSVNINTTGDQTQDIASLNTDVDRMEETLKDEESHIGVYIDGPAMDTLFSSKENIVKVIKEINASKEDLKNLNDDQLNFFAYGLEEEMQRYVDQRENCARIPECNARMIKADKDLKESFEFAGEVILTVVTFGDAFIALKAIKAASAARKAGTFTSLFGVKAASEVSSKAIRSLDDFKSLSGASKKEIEDLIPND